MSNLATALADRLSRSEIALQHKSWAALPLAARIIDAFPQPCAVVNEHRQILASNQRLREWLSVDELREVIGLRPGEALRCEHALEALGGCGTAPACAYCGAANAILESRRRLAPVEREWRATVRQDGFQSLDLKITAAPIDLGLDVATTLITITDISHEKRRGVLERVFLHDVANTAGALGGILKLMNARPSEANGSGMLQRAARLGTQLMAEIHEHRDLLAAESNELAVNLAPVSSRQILAEVADVFKTGLAGERLSLEIDAASADLIFQSDPILLRRVLVNLVKNAFEASAKEQAVRAGAFVDGERINFWVSNEGHMPPDVQLQVFQRTFSTKGPNRGLGTYSVKLLGERYLQGNVSFVSNESVGTVFTLSLPAPGLV